MDFWDVHMSTWPGSWSYQQKVKFLHAYKELIIPPSAGVPKYSDKVVEAILAENASVAMKAVGTGLSAVNFMYSGAIQLNFVNMVDYIHRNGFAQLRSGVNDLTIQLPNCPGLNLSTEQVLAVAKCLERVTFR